MRNAPHHWRYIVGAAATAYSLGCVYGITSPSLKSLNIETNEGGSARELYCASVNLGVVLGAVVVSLFLNKADSRECLALSFFPSFLGWLLIVIGCSNFDDSTATATPQTVATAPKSPNLELLYTGRFLLGVAGGISTVFSPLFLHDSVYSKNLSGLFQISLVFGIFSQQLLNAFLTVQVVAIINAIASLAIIIGLFEYGGSTTMVAVDEDPDEYETGSISFEASSVDNEDPSYDSSRRRTQVLDSPEQTCETQLITPQDSPAKVDASTGKYPTWLAAFVAANQQLCGLNAINFYIIQIFQQNGSALSNPTTYAIITTFVQLLITVFGGLCLYKYKSSERMNMATSCMGVLLALAGMTTVLYLRLDALYLMIASIAFQIFFSFGLGPTTWTIVAKAAMSSAASDAQDKDVLQKKTRSTSLAVVISQFAAFLVVFSFYPLVAAISMHGLFLMYSIFTFLYFIFIVLVL